MSRRDKIEADLKRAGYQPMMAVCEVARYLRRSERTVRRYSASGLLPSYRGGRLYRRADVARFLAS